MTVLNFLFRFLLTLSLIPLIYYDFERNPDISSYKIDYERGDWSFELGYELFGWILRFFFDFTFAEYWSVVVFLICFLLSILYANLSVWLIALPNILYQSVFLGTQVRFALATLLFLVFVLHLKVDVNKRCRGLLTVFSAASFHYFYLFFWPLLSIYQFLRVRFSRSPDSLVSLFLVVFSIFLSLFAPKILSFFFEIVGKSGYLGTKYFERKSFLSLAYLFGVVFFLLSAKLFENAITLTPREKKLLEFSFFLSIMIIATSGVAILSGRLMIILSFVEPVVIYSLLSSGKKVGVAIGGAFFSFYLLKNTVGLLYG